jgi:hypothetical protein
MNIPIFAFTDCKDPNTLTRLTARLTVLFEGSSIHAAGIDSDIEASGCILDALDALRLSTKPAIIIGNLAPRADKQYKNGAPFYIGHVGKTILIANRTCFTLLAKFRLINTIYETDVETVCKKFLPIKEANRIASSQFRSFEYVPRLARWVYEKKKLPSLGYKIPKSDVEQIWWVDNFGNCKTTITESELKKKIIKGKVTLFLNGKKLILPFYQKLSDVPKGKRAIIIGSSGYADTRFTEITIQGKNASTTFKITSGTRVEFIK